MQENRAVWDGATMLLAGGLLLLTEMGGGSREVGMVQIHLGSQSCVPAPAFALHQPSCHLSLLPLPPDNDSEPPARKQA